MHVDAVGTSVDLRNAQEHEIDQLRREPRLANISVYGAERLHPGGRGRIVVHPLRHASCSFRPVFSLRVGDHELLIPCIDDEHREQPRALTRRWAPGPSNHASPPKRTRAGSPSTRLRISPQST